MIDSTMTLAVDEFIRRFLIHVLPSGFHRIRHYGLFASGSRIDNIARARELLTVPPPPCQPNRTATRDQDRHLMTTMPKSQRRSAPRRFRWSQTRRGGACSNRPRRPQSARRSAPIEAADTSTRRH
jgi:hypothetical protein